MRRPIPANRALLNVTRLEDRAVPANLTMEVLSDATEGGAGGVIRVSRDGSTSEALTLLVYPSGTATAGSDYTNLPSYPSYRQIPAGASYTDIAIDAVNDSTWEGAETVIVSAAEYTAMGPGPWVSATLLMFDNEQPAAPDFVVNSTGDLGDSNPSDGKAWTGNFLPGTMIEEVTLRAAIQQANEMGIGVAPRVISCSGIVSVQQQTSATIVLLQPMTEVRVPLVIDGVSKDLLTVRRTTENAFPYFTIATSEGTYTDIPVAFKNMTIRDAQGSITTEGGAIKNNAILSLTNVNLLYNKANKGGAIYHSTRGTGLSGVLTLENCDLSHNEGIGAARDGGAIYATGNSRLTISSSLFMYNEASGGKGGAISINAQALLSLDDTEFLNNSANEGGAIYSSVGNEVRTPLRMNGGYFYQNTATDRGGAVYLSTTRSRIEGVNFDENSAVIGGAIYSKLNRLELLNCSFFGNTASTLGPIIAYHGVLGTSVWITHTNCGITNDDLIYDPAN